MASHSGGASHWAAAPSPALLRAAPAVPHPADTNITVTISNAVLPAWSSPGSLTLFWNVTATNGTVIQTFVSNQSVQMVAYVGSPVPYAAVSFASWAIPVVTGVHSYQTTIDNATVLPNTAGWVFPSNSWPGDGQFYFNVYFSSPNATGVVETTVAKTLSQAGVSGTKMIVPDHAPWAALDSPSPNGLPISTGNYTVVASYGGDWVSAATISITNPSGTVVFSAFLTQPSGQVGTDNFTVVLTGNWLIAEPGAYVATLTDTVLYNSTAHPSFTYSWTQTVNVTSASNAYKPVYINTTNYVNNSGATTQLIGGLSPGATAATLMVVGVIIGLIVALVLGRMMWGGSSAATPPAQPWSGSKGANECPVCHQTFASEDELKEHSKTAHGM